MSKKFTEFKYAWPVVVSAGLGIGLGMSPLPFYTVGVFAGPLSEEFGWGVGDVFLGLWFLTLGALIASPIVGLIADRYGVRRVVLVSVVTFSLTMMAFALNNGSLVFNRILWTLLAFFGAGTLPVTWARAVNNWFHDRRGLALGLALVGTGLFGAVSKYYANFFINEFGWRTAYVAVGALPLLIAFPIAFFMFHDVDHPRVQDRLAKIRSHTQRAKSAIFGGIRLAAAVKEWRFWLLAFSFLPISFAVGGPIPNLENMMGSKGFSIGEAVFLASLVGYAVVVGRLLGGYLLDHFWAPAVAAIILSLPAVAVIILAQGDVSFFVAAFAIFVLGLAAGVEYDLMAYLVSKYFGMAHFSAIYGALYGFFAAGAGVGPYFFGRAFEQTGSYDTILKYSAILFLIGALPLLLLGKYREFETEEAESE